MTVKNILMAFVLSAMVLCALVAFAEGDPMNEPKNLIDFKNTEDIEWQVINDGVMGGISRSQIRQTETGTGLFSGDLSLENNGGFASVRAQVGRHDLSAFAGLELRVRGDGRTYHLRLRTDDRFDGIAYRAYFESSAEEWVTIQVLFGQFRPTFRGRVIPDAPVLNTEIISQVGFLLADSRPGTFSLEIDYVRPFGSSTAAQ
jgi:NADH dehydrogenase [ubiquinone] 1 alpha subcomplex assembly factor 1